MTDRGLSLYMMQDPIIKRVEKMVKGRDPAHDFNHIMRVYKNAEIIGRSEGTDMEVLLPAVLLHDIVVYPKGSTKSSRSSDESAYLAKKSWKSTATPRTKYVRSAIAYEYTAIPRELFQLASKEEYFKMLTGLTHSVQ